MFFVVVGFGLVFWPAYEIMALLIERGLVAVFIASSPEIWERFRNGFYPTLFFVMVFAGIYYFGQWFWLIIFTRVMALIFVPPSEHHVNEGCFQSVITAVLIFIVLVLAAFAVSVKLSTLFHFPNVGGHLKYLPGMLIIGIGYYLLMAILQVLQKAALRNFEPGLDK